MRQRIFFDLEGAQLDRTTSDDVLDAVDVPDVTVRVDGAEVAAVEPSLVVACLRRACRIIEVAEEDMRPPGRILTRLAGFAGSPPVGGVNHLHPRAGEDSSIRAEDLLPRVIWTVHVVDGRLALGERLEHGRSEEHTSE